MFFSITYYYDKIFSSQMRRLQIMPNKPNTSNIPNGDQRGSGARQPGGSTPFNEGARAPKQPRGPRPPKR